MDNYQRWRNSPGILYNCSYYSFTHCLFKSCCCLKESSFLLKSSNAIFLRTEAADMDRNCCSLAWLWDWTCESGVNYARWYILFDTHKLSQCVSFSNGPLQLHTKCAYHTVLYVYQPLHANHSIHVIIWGTTMPNCHNFNFGRWFHCFSHPQILFWQLFSLYTYFK